MPSRIVTVMPFSTFIAYAPSPCVMLSVTCCRLPPACGIVARTTKKSTREIAHAPHGLARLPSLALLALALPAAADDYPNRPIRVIASQGPGGLSDIWMRAVADEMGPLLGGSVVVEDRTGAGGSIGARACAEAPPDGYTFCILPAEATVINPIISPIAGFDPKTRPRSGHQGVLPDPGVRGERLARTPRTSTS